MTNDYPTRICFHLNGNIKALGWSIFDIKNNEVFYRENDLPSRIKYHDNGNLFKEEWIKKVFYHRDNDLPAQIYYLSNGEIKKVWYDNGKTHRMYKPAYVYSRIIESNFDHIEWFVNNVKITSLVNEFIKEYNLPKWQEWNDNHKMLFKLKFAEY